ncbi:unannotated protein [freshwater metagenome]|uniref:Unannotated protein n=1 Tax=freshwater metagenome TaxID=449393 RepID=A0A6J6QFK4_9ZZZZ
MVVLATFDLCYKVSARGDIGNDGVPKFTDLGFECIAAIEEDHFIAALFDQLIDLLRLEVHAATYDAIFINL